MRRARDRARRAAQTAEERDARLRQIRDNRRQSLATESEEERAVRLQQMKDRLASETEKERAARLQRMSANQCHRLVTETEEERAARLQRMRDRLASETEEERAARLQQMSANQHHRLAAETGSEREARLQRNREGQRGQQSQLPLFEQPSVQAKMRKFMQRLLRWKCRNVLHARRGSQAFSFAHTLLSVCAVTETHTSNNYLHSPPQKPHLNCQTPAFASLPSLLFHTSYSTWFRPHHPPRISRAAPAAPHQPLCTSRATPAALHALAHPSHSSSRSPPQCSAFT